jgi:hypothetical protein
MHTYIIYSFERFSLLGNWNRRVRVGYMYTLDWQFSNIKEVVPAPGLAVLKNHRTGFGGVLCGSSFPKRTFCLSF